MRQAAGDGINARGFSICLLAHPPACFVMHEPTPVTDQQSGKIGFMKSGHITSSFMEATAFSSGTMANIGPVTGISSATASKTYSLTWGGRLSGKARKTE